MSICEIDLRVGGSLRYVWQQDNGTEMGMSGEFREVAPPERLVSTEVFDQPWYPGSATGTLELAEFSGKTRLTYAMQYDSREIRDGVNQPPMLQGMSDSYDRLAELLKSMTQSQRL